MINKQTRNKTPILNEKSIYIETINVSILDIERALTELSESKANKLNVLSKIENALFEKKNLIDNFKISKEEIKKTIRNILMSKSLEQATTVDIQRTNLEDIEEKLNKEKLNQKNLNKQKNKIINEVEMIENNIDFYLEEKNNLLLVQQLNYFRENQSEKSLDKLLIKPEGIEEFVESHQNPNIPKDFLDKIIFLKGDNNRGKHSLIKALGNELKRPVFKIKYEDYMNEYGLYNIFLLLITHLRKQRNTKNELISNYNEILGELNKTKKTKYRPKSISQLIDSNGIIHNYDLGNQADKNAFIKTLENNTKELKEGIENIEDSCILYIDDLEQIIHSSKYDKGELLGPIKSVIDDIKNEDHDVLLILVGNNLGQNHNDFKHKIDYVFDFDKIKLDCQDTFNKMISNYCDKLNVSNEFKKLNLNKLPKEYKNIKILDKIAKTIIKKAIYEDKKITQEFFDQEIEHFVNGRKSLFNGIGLKQN